MSGPIRWRPGDTGTCSPATAPVSRLWSSMGRPSYSSSSAASGLCERWSGHRTSWRSPAPRASGRGTGTRGLRGRRRSSLSRCCLPHNPGAAPLCSTGTSSWWRSSQSRWDRLCCVCLGCVCAGRVFIILNEVFQWRFKCPCCFNTHVQCKGSDLMWINQITWEWLDEVKLKSYLCVSCTYLIYSPAQH